MALKQLVPVKKLLEEVFAFDAAVSLYVAPNEDSSAGGGGGTLHMPESPAYTAATSPPLSSLPRYTCQGATRSAHSVRDLARGSVR